MTKQMKRRVLVVGGVVALGAVAYYLYNKSQESAPPQIGGVTPAPKPLPVATKAPANQAAILAYQTAQNNLNAYAAYIQAHPPKTETDLADAQAQMEQLKQRVRETAAALGITPNV
jgi:hypothetical protein